MLDCVLLYPCLYLFPNCPRINGLKAGIGRYYVILLYKSKRRRQPPVVVIEKSSTLSQHFKFALNAS